MNDLFVHQLQDIYYAEKQLVKALPKMAENATDKQLKQGFLTHLDETKSHVQRLEQVFQMHGAEVKACLWPADRMFKPFAAQSVRRRTPSRRQGTAPRDRRARPISWGWD
jgi:ferritin-like metal-binding protein YciE